MPVTLVHVSVKADFIDDFIAASQANREASVQEPGNRRFDFLQKEDDPTRFVFYEWYDSDGDVAAHKETDHYKAWRDTVAEMMAEPRKGVRHKALFPEFGS